MTTIVMTEKLKKSNCTHWWEIESPNGETSPGVCKYCGEVKIFRNTFGEKLKAKPVHGLKKLIGTNAGRYKC